jgi:hypothetical protein
MKAKFFLTMIISFLGFLLAGCSSSRPEAVKSKYSSDKTQDLINLVDSSTNYTTWSGQDWFDYDERLGELQKRADIVFESGDWNWSNIKILNSRLKVKIPAGEFPISDLKQYFPPNSNYQLAALVVVVFPELFMPDRDKPNVTIDGIMHDIDMTLQKGGVKRVMFQSHWHGLLVELQPKSNLGH